MINQRILVKPVNGSTLFEQHHGQDMIIVYRPKTDQHGQFILESNGGALFERVGGVKSGSTGTMIGPSVRGNRVQFVEYKDMPAPLGTDLINVYPVQLDQYQGTAWLLGDALKII